MNIELKELDVYKFRYKEGTKHFDPYWCFDGQLMVYKRSNGDFFLSDTYWGSGNNRTFTLEEALKEGELRFVCNLNDVREAKPWELNTYDDADIFDLSTQHGCYKSFKIKKDAKKSKDKMLRAINEKINSAKHDLEWAGRQIENYSALKQKIEDGNLDVYI